MELNAILQANAVVLAQMFKLLGDAVKYKHYNDIGHRFQIGINAVGVTRRVNCILVVETRIVIIIHFDLARACSCCGTKRKAFGWITT